MKTFDPAKIEKRWSSGDGDMGSVTDHAAPGRVSLSEGRYCLVYIRGTFVGGTGNDDFDIFVDSDQGTRFDHSMYTLAGIGATGDPVRFRVEHEDIPYWTFEGKDILVPVWPNPDPGNMIWGLEWGLQLVSDLLDG